MSFKTSAKTIRWIAIVLQSVAVSTGAAFGANAIGKPERKAVPADPVVMLQKVHNSWYIAGRIGAAFGTDTEFATLGTLVRTNYDPAPSYSGAVGYTFATESPLALRAEAEVGQASFAVDKHTVAGLGTFSGGQAFGGASSTYGLVNAYADYDLGTFAPFVSAGVGIASVDFDRQGTLTSGTLLNDKSNGVAWQVGAGTSYAINESLKLDLGYRYFGVNDVGVTATDTTTSNSGLRSHEVKFGIRKEF